MHHADILLRGYNGWNSRRAIQVLSDTTRVISLVVHLSTRPKFKKTQELCREMGVKVVDLWTAIQRRDDWSTACFT
ncbi:unnamed protein product [Camellia sinensis]